jgi:hypothetical protein
VKPSVGFLCTAAWISVAYHDGDEQTPGGVHTCGQLTTCLAALWRYRSCADRWLIHVRMKFFVKSIGTSSALARGSAFWKTWKPQYLRSADAFAENRDSETSLS